MYKFTAVSIWVTDTLNGHFKPDPIMLCYGTGDLTGTNRQNTHFNNWLTAAGVSMSLCHTAMVRLELKCYLDWHLWSRRGMLITSVHHVRRW